ncbi:MAG: DinB family protein [Acidobacteriales bacterium]|nr:DinB family protein [Terriglobales bacterium]
MHCKARFVLAAVAILLATAVASLAQTATLTAEERESLLKSLQAGHDAFVQSISGLSEKQWKFKPAPDRWSVAEVAEHITIAESTLLGMVQKQIMATPAAPEKRAEVKGKDEAVVTALEDRSHKAQAPEFLKPTNRWATRDELTKAFEEERKATMDYVKTTTDDLRDHFAPHPFLGPMDAYQWILLISAHSDRHTKQIAEVKADKNFPKE